MTMNNGNTLCLGGAQNPTVSAESAKESTYQLKLACRYPAGEPFKHAEYCVKDPSGKTLAKGKLSDAGMATVSGLKSGNILIEYGEHGDDYQVRATASSSPENAPKPKRLSDQAFFEQVSGKAQPFWSNSSKHAQHWGYLSPRLVGNLEIAAMLRCTFPVYFKQSVPENTAQHIALTLLELADAQGCSSQVVDDRWLDFVVSSGPLCLPTGELLPLFASLHEEESADNLYAMLRGMGAGNPVPFIQEKKWQSLCKVAIGKASTDAINDVERRIQVIVHQAKAHRYTAVVKHLEAHSKALKKLSAELPQQVAKVFEALEKKLDKIVGKGKVLPVEGSESQRSSTMGSVLDHVRVLHVLPQPLALTLTYNDREATPVSEVPYKLNFSQGRSFEGVLNSAGQAKVYGVPQQTGRVTFGKKDPQVEGELRKAYQALSRAALGLAKDLANKAQPEVAKHQHLVTQYPEQAAAIEVAVQSQLKEFRTQFGRLSDFEYFQNAWRDVDEWKSDANGLARNVFSAKGAESLVGNPHFVGLIAGVLEGNSELFERKLVHEGIDREWLGVAVGSAGMERMLLLLNDLDCRKSLVSMPRRFAQALAKTSYAITILLMAEATHRHFSFNELVEDQAKLMDLLASMLCRGASLVGAALT